MWTSGITGWLPPVAEGVDRIKLTESAWLAVQVWCWCVQYLSHRYASIGTMCMGLCKMANCGIEFAILPTQ